MPDHLSIFVSRHCVRVPSAHYEAKQFCADFIDSLGPAASNWTRSRILGELAKGGFAVGLLHGITVIGGLAPRGALVERDGRLAMVSNA